MELEKIALVLRSRQGWEAVDLGFRMAMRWARPLWSAWFAVFLPVAGALTLAFYEQPIIAAVLVWWLKPLYDRYLLFVLSRAVFGATPTLRDTLGASRQILASGLIWSLLTRFIDFSRSFNLPVVALEGQRGPPARARRKLLGLRAGGFAIGLTIVCIHFEWVVMYGLHGLAMLFETDVHWGATVADDTRPWWDTFERWGLIDTLFYFVAISLIEPFYVAGGFALYLNRRVMLEAWDIELALKRLAARYAPTLAMLVAFSLTWHVAPALAQDAEAMPETESAGSMRLDASESDRDKPPCAADDECADAPYEAVDTPIRREAHRILSEPDFGSEREVTRWKRIESDAEETNDNDLQTSAFIDAVAELFRVIAYLAIAAIVVALLYALLRYWLGVAPTIVTKPPPAMLFGLAIDPQSLPEDVPAAARAMLATGQHREAISLLYRGALSNLVHTRRMRISKGATEGDVLRLAKPMLGEAPMSYLTILIGIWTQIAYAARMPDTARIVELCDGYSSLMPSEANA